MGFATYSKLYANCVAPIMDYCSAVWGFKNQQKCNSVQQRACRYYMELHKLAPLHMLHAIQGDMGWDLNITRWHLQMLRYWNRVIRLDDNRLTKHILNWDYNLFVNNWSTEIHSIMQNIGNIISFESKDVIDLTMVKSKLGKYKMSNGKKKYKLNQNLGHIEHLKKNFVTKII